MAHGRTGTAVRCAVSPGLIPNTAAFQVVRARAPHAPRAPHLLSQTSRVRNRVVLGVHYLGGMLYAPLSLDAKWTEALAVGCGFDSAGLPAPPAGLGFVKKGQ